MEPRFSIGERLLKFSRDVLSTMDDKDAAVNARAGITGTSIAGSSVSGPVSDSFVYNHNDRHAAGGADAFNVLDLLDAVARIIVRKNSGANVATRRRFNLIEGTGIALTVADDSPNEEVDVTIAASLVAGHIIADEGGTLTQRANLNFVGTGIAAVDDSPDTNVIVNRWEPLTNGDPDAPELLFEDGDVLMVEITS
jgi:hypothetical protein